MPHTDSERLRDDQSAEQAETANSERTTESASEDAHERDTCPECGGPLRTDSEHGETACADCGLVVTAEEIDRGAEWTAYSAEEQERKSRVGAPTTEMMHDKGLSTKIDWQDRDAYGNSLSSRQRQKMNRLRKWNERFRTKDARDRNLKHALGEISRMASALGVPESVRETAGVIYRRALEENMLPGRSVEGVATAAIYAAARQAGIPRSLDEVTEVSRVDRVPIMRTYRYIARELDLAIPPSDPTDYLPRFASELDISDRTEQQARDLLETAINEGYPSGKSPVGLAASALYAGALITDEKVTQKRVSDVADISKVTIRNRYKDLLDLHDYTPPQ
jgi:transcription initiation factor TFIIB